MTDYRDAVHRDTLPDALGWCVALALLLASVSAIWLTVLAVRWMFA